MSAALRRGGTSLQLDDPNVTVSIRRSRAARRFSLSVSHIDGAARLTAPHHSSEAALRRFVEGHRDWLRDALGAAPQAAPICDGADILFEGEPLRIAAQPGSRGVRLRSDAKRLEIGCRPAEAGRRAQLWLREQARSRLFERSRHYADRLGVRFSRISIRDTRSRWGSCSSAGALSYSWRLILAPPRVLDYVAAHEVAHLIELNHSARFWALVDDLKPDWRDDRDWLKRHGAELHRYQVPPGAAALNRGSGGASARENAG
ncbi:MAG: SprT family zinc-dependent metalloprotease [Pseudomonadota bacterium]